ncbi:flavin-containing monooxygenase [Polymorphobacter fuscus]|uniref:NAD(P)-binding protein n=1 Tax=Sandarakinorhabdus fusca TaxID=1439888 RepID=A0A7C9KGY5_9SPHN|nr:NAD(P)/FAD-dependent oxidoreductase [Polymorphobacter fuscus]KAB7648421.1 NAD(P)/FAD-dependent oxidoreductase [Polymorphobacter fuscus]MQT15939.1 NAD(P)-binding protein [Polymorphobacter fuscus]NJC07785.1 cation diffusion facilitator CzcD-associated flavoprotein CzcO [Polymorphobacter fuscus]
MTTDHFDVLIVGAGLSGIGAAVHLQGDCPDRSFAILEGRDAIGGTWDLFRYPGIRSDSDMYTLGYSFKPWNAAKAIADGPSIRSYIREAASEHDVERHIRFGHKVKAADWDSTRARWTVTCALADGSTVTLSCNFLFMCSGYYSYDEGHKPDWPGEADFQGQIVHPQFWPETLDHAGEKVVIIGSGATAVTLVPEIARTAARVTMLQRSPTWMVSRPASDGIANALRAVLPAKVAYDMVRWKNVTMGMWFYQQTRKNPDKVRTALLGRLQKLLPAGYDMATHFTPRYNPWDQRLCLVPDADLFDAIKAGKADIATDTIARFEADGIRLASGALLEADIVIAATGLKLQALGGMAVSVDGVPQRIADALAYKGMMFSGIPNLAISFGYINASWTLRSDLIAGYVGRLLNYMRATGTSIATATPGADVQPERLAMDLSSGYVQRGADALPRSGSRAPWMVTASYKHDRQQLRDGDLGEEMVFSRPEARAPALAEAAE